MEYKVSKKRMDADNMKFYTKANKNRGLTPTGELLEGYENGEHVITLIVFRGKHTGYGAVRDCGDHYIKANHDRFDRIEKKTMTVTRDVDDR